MNLNPKTKQLFPLFQPSRTAVLLTVIALAIMIPLSAVAVRAAESSLRTIPAKPTQGPKLAALAASAVPPAAPATMASSVVPASIAPHKPSKFNMMSGNASWYGSVLQGHRTASGAIFDENQLTAAHRTLPFGTMVRVTDLRNHRTVVVKITDRGVLYSDRAIDLSHAAAAQLNMLRDGVHPVRLEVIPKNDPSLVASRSESASTQSKAD
jgi:rare lipoprotein A